MERRCGKLECVFGPASEGSVSPGETLSSRTQGEQGKKLIRRTKFLLLLRLSIPRTGSANPNPATMIVRGIVQGMALDRNINSIVPELVPNTVQISLPELGNVNCQTQRSKKHRMPNLSYHPRLLHVQVLSKAVESSYLEPHSKLHQRSP